MPNIPLGPSGDSIVSGHEFLLSRVEGHFIKKGILISSAARYQNGLTLPKGLAMGKISASGKHAQYDDAAGDGTQTLRGLLDETVDLADVNGNAADYQSAMIIWGYVKEANTFGVDANAKTDAATGANECHFIWG